MSCYEDAPKKFHLISSNGDSGSRLSVYQGKCPLCFSHRKLFHCCDCVRLGDFQHSNLSEKRFAEKQLRYLNIKSTHRNFEDKTQQYLQKHKFIENLKSNIHQKREKIGLLKKLVADTKKSVTKDIEHRKYLTDFNRTLRIKLPKYEDKVKGLEEYVSTKADDTEKRRQVYIKYEDELKQLIQESVQKLVKYIFPITKMIAKSDQQDREISDIEMQIADATRNIQSRGFILDSQSEVQHVIVAPFIPGNGDYSAYCDWVASNKDEPNSAANSEPTKPNPAIRISAALTYTAQLVQVLSYYLDIRYPFKMMYSEFCSSLMSEQQFTRRVNKLNANILFLCYMQHVKVSQIHPSQTLENILQLLDIEKSDLGKIGPVEPSDVISNSFESQLIQELEFGDNSDSEDENHFPHEWEAVPHLSPLDSNPPPTLNQQQQNSMAGGLMTSAAQSLASFWRGWTNGK